MREFSGAPESSEELGYTRVTSSWQCCAPTQGCGTRLLKLLICSPKLVDPRILLLEASMFCTYAKLLFQPSWKEIRT